ncbi:MAG TPA: epoxide hydrolase N-terminal domain-containing protein, partial [Propionibacteriaceae bacterium]
YLRSGLLRYLWSVAVKYPGGSRRGDVVTSPGRMTEPFSRVALMRAGPGSWTTLVTVQSNDARPFQIGVPDEQLLDLRRRLAQTRWPEPATVSDWSQGVPLQDVDELCAYWRTQYDWRAAERRLNRWPQYLSDIDGLAIHYFHVPSPNPSAVPLILTHGWPGSFFEFEQAMERLADPPSSDGAGLRPSVTRCSTRRLAFVRGFSRNCGAGPIIRVIFTRCSAGIRC